jgi:hypothetical protein
LEYEPSVKQRNTPPFKFSVQNLEGSRWGSLGGVEVHLLQKGAGERETVGCELKDRQSLSKGQERTTGAGTNRGADEFGFNGVGALDIFGGADATQIK